MRLSPIFSFYCTNYCGLKLPNCLRCYILAVLDEHFLGSEIILCLLCCHAHRQFQVVIHKYLRGNQLDLVCGKEAAGTDVAAPTPGQIFASCRNELVLILDFVLHRVCTLP